MSRVAITPSKTLTGPLVQVDGCPRCRRPLTLSYAGVVQDGVEYVDNPNVVFEAGMLHARTSVDETDKSGEPCGWIPIREAESAPAPFDFSPSKIMLLLLPLKSNLVNISFVA